MVSIYLVNKFMKTIMYIVLTVVAIFISGCYSAKSMGDKDKADKYLIVY